MAHWNLEPVEREDVHGAPMGTYRMVASMEGTKGGLDCCEHEHPTTDEALRCGEASLRANAITGHTKLKSPSVDDLADAAKVAHGRSNGDWHEVARVVAHRLGHVVMALCLLMLGAATAPACSAAREGSVDLAPTTPRRADCTPGAWRCNDRVPEVCRPSRDGVTRWWPTTQPAADGFPARCAVCVVEARAHCVDPSVAADASRDAADASDAD